MMRRNPGFTVVAALSLALGIGANTAIFSLVDTVLLRTLPVQDPERLVQIQAAFRNEAFKLNKTTQSFSRRTFEYFRDRNQVFADTFAFDSLERPDVTVDGSPEYTRGVDLVSGNYFSALGVNAILGRILTLEDDKTPGAHPVAVISYSYWKRRFGLDPAVLGKNISCKRRHLQHHRRGASPILWTLAGQRSRFMAPYHDAGSTHAGQAVSR